MWKENGMMFFTKTSKNRKKFQKIEYVTGEKPSDKMSEASKKYYKMRDRLKKNDYIDRFGDLQKVEHFMAHYEDGTADVLDEDWFTVNSEDERIEYRITPTRWKHINKHPNQAHSLTQKDKAQIKKYCKKLQGLCDIKSLKRININDIKDPDKRVETVEFLKGKKKVTK